MENSTRNILNYIEMKGKDLKNIIYEMAQRYGFVPAFGGWYKESNECIATLEFRKSNFGNCYQLLLKIFIQGAFNKEYHPSKELMSRIIGHVNSSEPKKYMDALNLDNQIQDADRKNKIELVFSEHIHPFTEKALTKHGIKTLLDEGAIFLPPSIQGMIQ